MSATHLRDAREAAEITLPRMAEIIGYDLGNLSRVERGQSGARVTEWVASRYELALGREPWSLVRECGTLPATLHSRINAIPG